MKPLQDRVVIERIADATMSGGGILLIEGESLPSNQRGTVIARGDGLIYESGVVVAPTVQVGDIVIFPRMSGTEVQMLGKKHVILRECEILAIEEPGDKVNELSPVEKSGDKVSEGGTEKFLGLPSP